MGSVRQKVADPFLTLSCVKVTLNLTLPLLLAPNLDELGGLYQEGHPM